jgi:hypothetical protein
MKSVARRGPGTPASPLIIFFLYRSWRCPVFNMRNEGREIEFVPRLTLQVHVIEDRSQERRAAGRSRNVRSKIPARTSAVRYGSEVALVCKR